MNWELRADGRYCKRHSHAFPIGDVCFACVADPGPEFDSVAVERSPLERERDIRCAAYESDSKRLARDAREMLDGTDLEKALAVKLFAESTKIARLVEELTDKRIDHEHDLRLIRHEREMAGLRGPN